MTWILNLETATSLCCVSLAREGIPVVVRETLEEKAHASRLTGFISECLDEAGITFAALDAIAVSNGPGSYTGLRIGLATAKGLCFSIGKPLILVNTLEALAAGWFETHSGNRSQWVCPMLDARRMEVYTAVFNSSLDEIMPTQALIIEPGSFSKLLLDHEITFTGEGMIKCKPLLETHANARFDALGGPTATGMAQRAYYYFQQKQVADLAAAGPYYLKEFLGIKPAKNQP